MEGGSGEFGAAEFRRDLLHYFEYTVSFGEKARQVSWERERESKISCSSRRLFRCWTPRHLLFRYFSYQVDKGLRCLTPSLAHLFSGCANTVFHFGSPLSFLTTISPSLSASSFLSRRTFLLGDTQTRRISRENSSNSHGRGLDKVESLEVSFYCSYVQSG